MSDVSIEKVTSDRWLCQECLLQPKETHYVNPLVLMFMRYYKDEDDSVASLTGVYSLHKDCIISGNLMLEEHIKEHEKAGHVVVINF